MHKISVIIPAYNVEKYLEKCLESVVNQTLKDIEVILINDGSKDNTWNIIESFSNKYQNIKVFNKPNTGVADTRNFGLSKVTGEYIGFLDSDDYIEPTMFEELYNKAKSNDFDVCVCDAYIVANKQTYIDSGVNKDLFKSEIKSIFSTLYPVLWNKIYKKELFNDLLFKEGVWFEDVELLYRLLPRINSVGVVKKAFYYYIQREGSITSKVNNKIYDYIDNWNGIIDYYKANNLYNTYKKELEYSYVRYIYATFIKRVREFDYNNYQIAVNKAIKNVKEKFPNYRSNKYFYKSLKGIYLLLFNKLIANIYYRQK